jgi:hypothetical protein
VRTQDTDGPELVTTGGALNVRYRGRLLYSERGPALSAARAALACETGPGRLHLVFSPLLWYGLPELLARIGEGSRVLCVESEPGLAALSLDRLPENLRADPRLSFMEARDSASIVGAARALGSFRRCVPLRASGGAALHAESYSEAAALLQAEFAAGWRSKAALLSMGRLWARNIFRNLAALPTLELAPLPRFEGAAIVCGAGPSLEAALPLMAARRDRLTVLACDTALPSLLEWGIEPDLVVCLEGQAHNLADFTPAGSRRLALMADLSSHPATFRALSGPKHLSAVEITASPFLERVAALGLPALPCPPLGSIGVHAVHIARRLCSGPVLLTGLDFSYQRSKTHARGSPSLAGELRRQSRLLRWPSQVASAFRAGVRAEGGPGLLTDPALSAYAALLADEAGHEGPAVIDLRQAGLALGLPTMGLAEADAWLSGLEKPARQAVPSPTMASDGGACVKPQALRGFIEAEAGRLEAIRDFMKGRTAPDPAVFYAAIEEADYLLWPLPDAGRLRDGPQDLLNRLLVEVEYWRWKLSEILATLG